MTLHVATTWAATLASHVDTAFADAWSETGPTLAVMSDAPGDAVDLAFIQLDGHPETSLPAVPRRRALAACVTSLGRAVHLDAPSEPPVRVRVTLALACCHDVTTIRRQDGHVDHLPNAEGLIVQALRRWADLVPCPACAHS